MENKTTKIELKPFTVTDQAWFVYEGGHCIGVVTAHELKKYLNKKEDLYKLLDHLVQLVQKVLTPGIYYYDIQIAESGGTVIRTVTKDYFMDN